MIDALDGFFLSVFPPWAASVFSLHLPGLMKKIRQNFSFNLGKTGKNIFWRMLIPPCTHSRHSYQDFMDLTRAGKEPKRAYLSLSVTGLPVTCP